MADPNILCLTGRRILLAEDEMATALALTMLLKTTGCTIVKAARCEKGLAYLGGKQAFDAAVLDVTLVDGPVYPLAQALDARDVPFIFLTGYSTSQLPVEWQHRPRLEKPMNPEALIDWLVQTLANDSDPKGRA